MNIFERITRLALRFDSVRGAVSVEDLWTMKLTAKDGFDLDNVAKGISRDLKAAGEESFVATAANPARAALELRLEVIKHIIAVKQAEAEDKANAAARAQQKEMLTEALATKQKEKLANMSEDEIKAALAAQG